MKNIAIFGATGMTGVCVIKAALDKGLKIRALLRDPTKLPKEYNGKVDVIKGDVLHAEDVKRTLEGQDAVIVVLGTRNHLGPTTVMSDGLKNIIAGMKALNISVVSVCLSLFLFYDPKKVPVMYHEVTADHRRMFEALKTSGLQWVAVNAAYISDQRSTGYIVQHDANPRYSTVSKYDLAQFFVDSLTKPEHFQKAVGIASNPRR
ncbi:flavin reductase (NADPH)-like [Homalodisca vitripennis]|uniref:flavin reductase (NADPH)-like n=1 Tax=Homalodisca vitripennis TaxID=197043 RepID=UPI001EEB7E53|nr:flavin reductase (NADPH)-like [Homalodisca vitripennis]XP_046658895.1 flavin reductase (NADPH)-like [Homalodisca vitripennis]